METVARRPMRQCEWTVVGKQVKIVDPSESARGRTISDDAITARRRRRRSTSTSTSTRSTGRAREMAGTRSTNPERIRSAVVTQARTLNLLAAGHRFGMRTRAAAANHRSSRRQGRMTSTRSERRLCAATSCSSSSSSSKLRSNPSNLMTCTSRWTRLRQASRLPPLPRPAARPPTASASPCLI